MLRAAVLFSLLNCAAIAQADDVPRDVLTLKQIQRKMRDYLSRLPDYTCIETIVRAQRADGANAYRPMDTLRVEVLHIDNRELYAWPGEKKFEEQLGLLVGVGTTSSGEFALHARSIFLGDSQNKFVGEETIRGRKALRYDYRIGTLSSGMTLTYAGHSGRVSTRGSFWVDPETLDLLRLDVHAEEIPVDLPYTEAVSTVDYGRVRIGASDTMLPQSAELILNYSSGLSNRNDVQFSQCRSYAAASEIRFETEPRAAAAPEPPKIEKITEVDVPADLRLGLKLEQEINSKTAAEGDLITARIQTAVKRKNVELIPAGAIARGRIRRLENYDQPRPHFIVGLEFQEIVFDGKRAAFTGRLDWIDPLPGITWSLHTEKTKASVDHSVIGREHLRTADLPGVGTFFVDGGQFALPAGFQMLWRTVELKK